MNEACEHEAYLDLAPRTRAYSFVDDGSIWLLRNPEKSCRASHHTQALKTLSTDGWPL